MINYSIRKGQEDVAGNGFYVQVTGTGEKHDRVGPNAPTAEHAVWILAAALNPTATYAVFLLDSVNSAYGRTVAIVSGETASAMAKGSLSPRLLVFTEMV